MKTFFHPDSPSTTTPLVGLALERIISGTHAIRSYCAANVRKTAAAGSVFLVGLPIMAFSGSAGMPGLVEGAEKQLPAEVEEAAREVFDGRFAKDGKSYYTLVAHYAPSPAAELAEMPGLNKMPGIELLGLNSSTAPLLLGIELVEIQDLRTEVEPDKLKRSDELNDITWKGRVLVKGGVERRRTLDLTGWLKTVSKGKHTTPIPWLEAPITLEHAATGGKKADAQPSPMDALSAMTSMFMPNMEEALVDELKAGEWGDWVESDTACYQHSHFTLRGGKANSSTNEDMRTALGDRNLVTLFALHADNFMVQSVLSDENMEVFLTKPNLKALYKSGMID